MGANCCVAASHKDIRRGGTQCSTHRNVTQSPSWTFQWSNQTHIEDSADNVARASHGNNRNVGFEIKSSADMEIEGLSRGGNALDSFGFHNLRKSSTHVGRAGNSNGTGTASNLLPAMSVSVDNASFSEGTEPMKSSTTGSLPKSKSSTLTTAPSSSKGETSFSQSHSLLDDPTSSRKARRSPGYQLSRQISDNRVPTYKSLNENKSAEGRRSHGLSFCSNDLSAGESHGGSSDGWSMHLFMDLVALSQRERWSFDRENMSSNPGNITRSNSRQVSPPPADSQICGVCSKLLKEIPSWSSQKIVSNSELSVVAVLVCGHVYHAECLENVTPEIDQYDPSCPVCVSGEKSVSKLLGKGKAEIKGRNKISRNAVADIDLDGVPITEQWKSTGYEVKESKIGSSSSFKSFGRTFLRRNFSIGSRPSRCVTEREVTGKNFWGRYRRNG